MASEQSSTPSGTGHLSVHDAATQFESLLSFGDEGDQRGEPAPKGKPKAEKADEHAEEEREEEEQEEGDESESGESEGSESDEEDEGDDEATAHDVPDDTEIEIDGVGKVSVRELKRGFLREKDYTQKTQALSETRKQLEAVTQTEAQNLRGERDRYAQSLTQLQEYMEALKPVEPDWQVLYSQDPARYAAEREAWRSYHESLQHIEGQKRTAQEQAQQQHAIELKRYVESEKGKLLEALPEWNKPEVARVEKQKIFDWGQKQGFSAEELGSLYDHRTLVTVRKAMLYDELMSKKKDIRATPPKGPKAATPGSNAQKPGKTSEVTRAKQKLAKTGRQRDAADAIYHLLGDD